MEKYTVLLTAKHTNETHTIMVEADNEDDAMEIVDNMIDESEEYKEFRSGWKIAEAY